MQELIVSTRVCADEEGREHTFRYILLIREGSAGRFQCESYGVRIEEPGGGSARRDDLTLSRAAALDLLTFLAEHLTTPVNLPEVLADLGKENRLPQQGRGRR